jgi:molybdopterin-guanine dinucleotide biosynthesis protein A
MSNRAEITALILAGGQGRRMAGRDKGLVTLDGKPLVQHVIEAVATQVGGIILSANRNVERYRAFGYPVVGDPLEGYQGPLAGFLAGLRLAPTPLLATLPCDSPRVVPDLVSRLRDALENSGAQIAVAHDGDRLQPVHTLMRTGVRESLEAYLAEGERKTGRWFGRQHWVAVDFTDAADSFFNVNTPEDRARLEGTS